MNKAKPSVTETETEPDEKESTAAAFFYGTLFWAIAGSIIVWFAAPEAGKIKVIRIGGLIIGIIMLMGALTIWPKRKHFVLEMSAVTLLAAAILWRDGSRVWATILIFAVCAGDTIFFGKIGAEHWLNNYDKDKRDEREP